MATHGAFNRIHLAPTGPDRLPGRPVRPSLAQRALARLAGMVRAPRPRRRRGAVGARLGCALGLGRGEALMEASRAPWDISRGDIGPETGRR